MTCPRCSAKMQNIIEYIVQQNNNFIREYYCSNCKGSLVEKFDSQGLISSEWIDFNV
jgi:hypothetical protein